MRSTLRESGYSVSVACSADELLAALRSTWAECLLLDLSMPGRSGLELVPLLRQLEPMLKIVVLTMHLDRALADRVMSQGAKAFVPKDSSLTELRFALEAVLDGRSYVSPLVLEAPRGRTVASSRHDASLLSSRQQQVLHLLGNGHRPSEIARALNVSPSTITFHMTNLMHALGIGTHAELVRSAVLLREKMSPPLPRSTPRCMPRQSSSYHHAQPLSTGSGK